MQNTTEDPGTSTFASFKVQNQEKIFYSILAKHTNKFNACSQGINSGQCWGLS